MGILIKDGVQYGNQPDITGKVDKVTGKGLSTNDYTTEEKEKLAGIETGAQVNTITGVKGDAENVYQTGDVNLTPANVGAKAVQTEVNDPVANGTAVSFIDGISQNVQGVISPTKKTVPNATINSAGLMSAADKHKLDSIAGNTWGAHNAIYRGINIGTSVTQEQWNTIEAGTFDDLYIGDYWLIDGIEWRIAAFNYWLYTGDIKCNTNHIVIVPSSFLNEPSESNKWFNVATDATDGAYIGSDWYSDGANGGKAECVSKIISAFGSNHILEHREYLQSSCMENNTNVGYATTGTWVDSTVEIMSEQMVYGCKIYGDLKGSGNFSNRFTIDKTQLPLFTHASYMIPSSSGWWLRDIVSEVSVCMVDSYGRAYFSRSNAAFVGIRPAFGIKA